MELSKAKLILKLGDLGACPPIARKYFKNYVATLW